MQHRFRYMLAVTAVLTAVAAGCAGPAANRQPQSDLERPARIPDARFDRAFATVLTVRLLGTWTKAWSRAPSRPGGAR